MSTLSPQLIDQVKSQYKLHWHGSHGICHWARVLEIGSRLAQVTGADPQVVQLFALFHDACRENEYGDPGHGRRGAELATVLRGHTFELADQQFQLLPMACCQHTVAQSHDHITVQTCFDADRLDLGRVGITPNPELLCTEAAREPAMLDWAIQNSQVNHVPKNILGKLFYHE